MSLGRVSVKAVTPEIGARPGDVTECTVRVRNDGSSPIPLFVRVHGLGQSSPYVPIAGPALAPGAEVDVEVPLEVPETFGFGAHSLAIEVGSGKPEDRSALAKVLLTIGAPAGITTRIEPSVVRGGRRTRFEVEVHNSGSTRAEVTLQASAPDVRVTLGQRQIAVDPGTTAIVRAKVRGPRRWVGDPAQHVLTVEARSGSVPLYTTASYRQRALLPRRARGGMIGVAFVVLWALIAAAVVLVWARRDDDSKDDATEQVANGQALTPLTNPDGSPATGGDGTGGADGGDGSGGAAGAGGSDAADASGAPTATIVRGTVKAGDTGADDGVLITLTPTVPGETQQVATESGVVSGPSAGQQPAAVLRPGGPGDGMRIVPAGLPAASDSGPPAKFWPARYGTYRPGALDNVRTLSVASVASGADGSWQFQQVPLRQSYEVSFAKPGYTTQSFIVSPKDDGEPVELEVELAPGDGALAGTVTGPQGAAEVTITDGTLTFTTTTSTDANTHGRWAVDSLSTPGTYTVTVTSHGFGTEVMQVHLDAGEERSGLNLGLTADVGSISGTVMAGGAVRGGVTVVAAAGDKEITTTSLTEGATGTYTFPQLTLGATYTVTASADGYVTQTRSVTVDGNTTGVDFALIKATASIVGRVVSSRAGTTVPLVSAAVSVAAGELQVRTSSAAAPDAGAFSVTDLPPGSYVLAASRYDHPEASQLVTLSAGQVFDAGDIVLTYQARPPLTATGSLIVRTVDSFGADLPGATVQLIDVGGTIPAQSKSMSPTESSVSFSAITIGTYTVRVTKANYRPTTIGPLSIGLGAVERQVTLLQYGTARGTVIDAAAGFQFDGIAEYVTADEPDDPVRFLDPANPLNCARQVAPLPPESQVGPGAVNACLTSGPAPGRTAPPADLLVVKYDDGSWVLDTNNDGVPDQPLAQLKIGSSVLGGYELLLYRMDGTNPVCISPITESGSEWEIDPTMQLLAGSYVLRFSPLGSEVGTACAGRGRLPDGYAAIPAGPDGNVAAFVVDDHLDRKILVNPVQAGPYTQIAGRVLVPRIGGFDDFAAAQASGLAVGLDCGPGRTADATVGDGGSGQVVFTLSRVQVQQLFPGVTYDPNTGALGACALRATYTASNEFLPTAIDVPIGVGLRPLPAPPAAPAPGDGWPDQYVSVGLVDDPGIIFGTVQWRDLGATGSELPTHAVSGATVTASQVTVGFTPSVEGDPADPDNPATPAVEPSPDPADVSAGPTGTDGAFSFVDVGARQVLGTATYDVTAPRVDPGQVTITATPGEWSATADPVPAPEVIDNGNSVDVFLPPHPGSLAGSVEIETNRDAVPYGDLCATTRPPGASAAAPASGCLYDDDANPATDPVSVCSDTTGAFVCAGGGSYSIANAAAGTWELGWQTTAGSNLLLTSAAADRTFVDTGLPATAEPVTAVELGQIDVALTDDVDDPIDGGAGTPSTADDSTVTVELQGGGPATQPASYTSTPQTPGPAGTASFARLPVSAADALGQPVTYLVSADVPKHDEPTSQVWVSRNGLPEVLVAAGTMTDVPITVTAGDRIAVRFATPAYARITGRLVGLITPPNPPSNIPAATEPLVIGNGVTVTAIRSNGEEHDAVVATDGTGTPLTDGSYVIDVPAGTYSVRFEAPNYVTSTPAIGTLLPDTTQSGVDAELRLHTRAYSLTAVAGVAAGAAAVEGATVQLWWGAVNPLALPAGGPVHSGPTIAAGSFDLAAVYPGSYTLIVRKQDPLNPTPTDLNFPVIAAITIPRAAAPGSSTVHRVAMPPVGGAITGTVRAESASTGRPLALPVLPAPGLQVTRSYDLAQVNGPGLVPNAATEANQQPGGPAIADDLVEAAAGDGTSYTFNGLAYGVHTLTFGTASGFTVTPASPAAVTVAGAETHDVTYEAADVPVDVTVTSSEGGGVAGATVTIIPTVVPGQATPGDATPSTTTTGLYQYAGVAPDLADYTLHVEAPGYADRPDTPLPIGPSATALPVDVTLTPVATITGTTATNPTGPAGPFTVRLMQGASEIASAQTTATAPGFEFQVLPAGVDQAYTVEFALADHEPGIVAIDDDDLVLTQTLDIGTVTAVKHASATIKVANTPVPSGLNLTVTSSLTGDSVSGAGSPTGDTWTVTGMKAGATYSFEITSDDYEDHTSLGSYTAAPGGTYGTAASPQLVTLTPKPASATVSVTNTVALAGLSLTVTSSAAGDVISGTGPPGAGNSWTVGGLDAGNTYTFTITADNYDTLAVGSWTATPNGTQAWGALTLTPKPAGAQITVTNGASIAGLSLAVSPNPSGITGLGAATSGGWDVGGIPADGTTYTFTITSTDYQDRTFTYQALPNEATHAFGPFILTGKDATATITIGGPDGDKSNADVTCSSGIVGTRGGPTSPVWTFKIPVGQSCIFTATVPGKTASGPASPGYTATPNGTFALTLTPA